ncbi:hypothetical protein D3C73_1244120 [compost metagenome]
MMLQGYNPLRRLNLADILGGGHSCRCPEFTAEIEFIGKTDALGNGAEGFFGGEQRLLGVLQPDSGEEFNRCLAQLFFE